jgi:hypothetical protein
MQAVEFQARVENGVITIPDQYKQDFANGNIVKVIVLKQTTHYEGSDIIDQLTENPIKVEGFLTRDETHTRTL